MKAKDEELAAQQEENNKKIEELEAEKAELEDSGVEDFLAEIKKDDAAFLNALMKEEITIKGPNGEQMSLDEIQELIEEYKAKTAKKEEEGVAENLDISA